MVILIRLVPRTFNQSEGRPMSHRNADDYDYTSEVGFPVTLSGFHTYDDEGKAFFPNEYGLRERLLYAVLNKPTALASAEFRFVRETLGYGLVAFVDEFIMLPSIGLEKWMLWESRYFPRPLHRLIEQAIPPKEALIRRRAMKERGWPLATFSSMKAKAEVKVDVDFRYLIDARNTTDYRILNALD